MFYSTVEPYIFTEICAFLFQRNHTKLEATFRIRRPWNFNKKDAEFLFDERDLFLTKRPCEKGIHLGISIESCENSESYENCKILNESKK